MSVLLKVLLITICMNLCLTFAGISLGNYSTLNQFVSVENGTMTPSEKFNLLSNDTAIPISADDAVTDVSTSDNTFIDTIRLTFSFLGMVMVGLFFPIYWGFILGMPLWLCLLLLIQTIVGITAIVLVFRGTGS
jgi:F0F1-type ATP synthase assembly protein I